MSLLVLGTVAFDAIETPFGKTERVIGGAATYISLAASFFRTPIYLVSIVGDDFPQAFLDELQARGIDTGGVQVVQGEKSFFWSGRYHNDLNTRDTLDTQLNVLTKFTGEIPPAYQNAEYVMLGNLDPKLQLKGLESVSRKPKLAVMDTMNLWLDIARPAVEEVLAKVDVLSINDEEARQLTGEYSLVTAARKILAMGPEYVVIKKGEHGALLFHQDEVFVAPALPLEQVFDPTGAGDCFAGGFIGYLAESGDVTYENLKSAVMFGSVMASFCVEKFGPERLLEIDSNDIQQRLKQFLSLMRVSAEMPPR